MISCLNRINQSYKSILSKVSLVYYDGLINTDEEVNPDQGDAVIEYQILVKVFVIIRFR